MRDRYQIEIHSVGGCSVTARICGHVMGYNRVSVSEIGRRYGKGMLLSLSEQAQANLSNNPESLK